LFKQPPIHTAGNCIWLLEKIWGVKKKAKGEKKERLSGIALGLLSIFGQVTRKPKAARSCISKREKFKGIASSQSAMSLSRLNEFFAP